MIIKILNNLRVEGWNFLNLIKGICWAAPRRPTRPVLIQLYDLRNRLESGTETSVVSRTGERTHLKQGSGVTPHHVRRVVGRMQWGLRLGVGGGGRGDYQL